jgi:hypothetical protein
MRFYHEFARWLVRCWLSTPSVGNRVKTGSTPLHSSAARPRAEARREHRNNSSPRQENRQKRLSKNPNDPKITNEKRCRPGLSSVQSIIADDQTCLNPRKEFF